MRSFLDHEGHFERLAASRAEATGLPCYAVIDPYYDSLLHAGMLRQLIGDLEGLVEEQGADETTVARLTGFLEAAREAESQSGYWFVEGD